MAYRQYIGSRYVPIFGRKGEATYEWDNLAPYEPLTVVMHQGNSFTSTQYVPTGIDIDNREYWAETGNWNAQVEAYRQEVRTFDERITTNTTAIANETSAREAAIANETSAREAAIANETSAREAADAIMTADIAANTTSIANETSARETAIANETSAREAADAIMTADIAANATSITNIKASIKNVIDYGAKGDGITDDSNAIANAIIGGGIVLIPPGTYKLENAVNLESDLHIIGYGAVLYVDSPNAPETLELPALIFSTDSSSVGLRDCIIEGLEITGNATFKSVGITLRQSRNITSTVINRVVIRNCHIHGLGFRGINAIGAVSGDSPFGHGTPDITVDTCQINDCGGHTICNSGTAMKVFNCRVYNSGSECISVDNGCYRFFIDNSYFENARAGAGCISIDESNSVFITNSIFNQPNHDRPAIRCNNSSGNVNNIMITNCIMEGGTYSLSIGGTNYFTQMVLSNCEASGASIGAVLSRNDDDIIITSGNNWFRNMTAEQKSALSSKLRSTDTGHTII